MHTVVLEWFMPDNQTAHFVLTPEQRSRLVPNINADALQRFLQAVAKTGEEREAYLQFFVETPGQSTSFQLIGPFRDPRIKALIDEVYAPTWEAWGAEAIESSDSPLPGRELARARLLAKMRPSV